MLHNHSPNYWEAVSKGWGGHGTGVILNLIITRRYTALIQHLKDLFQRFFGLLFSPVETQIQSSFQYLKKKDSKLEENYIMGIRVPQLAEIPTLFHDRWRSLN